MTRSCCRFQRLRRPPIVLPAVIALHWAGAAAWAYALQPGVYDITAQTVMPHLEENLRDAIVRERRCLRSRDLPSLFPVLRHRSLGGCALVGQHRDDGELRFVLHCESPHVATGTARLTPGPGRITGVLEVKMGGKNTTFTQRIDGVRQGECEEPIKSAY